MSTDPVLDPATIESLRALSDDGEFLKEIVGIFVDDTPQRIAELDQCQVSGDTAKFTRAAHSIKGSAANIGATQLGAAAGQLEHDSKASPLASLTPGIDAVKAEYAKVEVEMKKLIA